MANLSFPATDKLKSIGNALAMLPQHSDFISEEEAKPFMRFIELYWNILPIQLWNGLGDSPDWKMIMGRIWKLQSKLRTVWREADSRSKHYGIFWIIKGLDNPDGWTISESKDDSLSVPRESEFERALFQLLKDGDLAKFCPSLECLAPYFFATRRSQKYCSDVCAGPAQREAKLRWWNEKGSEKRAKRLKLQSSGVSDNRKKKSRKENSNAL